MKTSKNIAPHCLLPGETPNPPAKSSRLTAKSSISKIAIATHPTTPCVATPSPSGRAGVGISFFPHPITNTTPSHTLSLLDVHHLIKEAIYAHYTNTLRSIKDPKEARKYKSQNFDYVTFSGTFTKRSEANLIKHSSLLTIDFDHIPNPKELKQKLLNDIYLETQLLFISPSGDGLKWIIQIDLTLSNHKTYFNAIENYIAKTYNLKIDTSGKDISRACFLPYDPEVYINPKYQIPP